MEQLDIKVLCVEDDPVLRMQIVFGLSLYVRRVVEASNGQEGIKVFEREHPDVVITDVRMPVMDGLEMFRRLKVTQPLLPIIVCTAFTETDYLMRCIELGVSAYIPKPIRMDDLESSLRRLAEPIIQHKELERLKLERTASIEAFLGASEPMREPVAAVSMASRCDIPVLIQGETGTGKSRLAFFIHRLSSRREGPFITVHLAGIPENLIEGALFGHDRGAFTGAERKREGFFKAAHGGTLFIDDLDAIPSSAQSALLQAVETRSIVPLGQTKPLYVDVRIITASNRLLNHDVAAGFFRQDLYYRLRGITITLPPLREIPQELPRLVAEALQDAIEELQVDCPVIATGVYELLASFSWPGNIRELRHIVFEAALKADRDITPALLRSVLSSHEISSPHSTKLAVAPSVFPASPHIDDLLQWGVRQAMNEAGGKRMEAARLMGVSYNTFKGWLKQHYPEHM